MNLRKLRKRFAFCSGMMRGLFIGIIILIIFVPKERLLLNLIIGISFSMSVCLAIVFYSLATFDYKLGDKK